MAVASGRGTKAKARRSFATDSVTPEVRRIGFRARLDIYHSLLTCSWPSFFALLALAYFIFNTVFAVLFLLQDKAIANAKPGSFADAFFFSVQTMVTIGYGQLYPQTLYANTLVTIEVLLAMMGLALATGVIFARFSRPTARVVFSRVAVIATYNGQKMLMFRAANYRRNQILEAQISVSLLRDERSREGETLRRFYDLPPMRARTPMFALTWTVMHPIDEKSPLYRCTPHSLRAEQAEIVVTLVGLDTTFAQTVHARHSYVADEIVWDHRFVDILSQLEDGTRVVDYRRFHEVEPLAAAGE
jgi:inward rectifier potassium channel